MNDPQVADAGRIAPTRWFNVSKARGPSTVRFADPFDVFKIKSLRWLAARLQGRGIRLIVGSINHRLLVASPTQCYPVSSRIPA